MADVKMSRRIHEYMREFSWQHRLFSFVQLAIAVWLCFLWRHLPNPGWAVAILAGVAAAMSIHGEMRGWQKAIWMLLIGCLLIIELRSISADREASNAQALGDREKQDQAFKGVRDAQDKEFQATAQALNSAISGIQSTLRAADTTLIQTQPHAALRFDKFEFQDQAPKQITSNVLYKFNYSFANGGTETATDVDQMIKVYMAPADNKDEQLKLVQSFEKEWSNGKLRVKNVVVPDLPSFESTERTFTNDESRVLSSDGTIYYLLRFEYSDNTGRWRTDSCGLFQRTKEGINTRVLHSCLVFERFRYPAKQH